MRFRDGLIMDTTTASDYNFFYNLKITSKCKLEFKAVFFRICAALEG